MAESVIPKLTKDCPREDCSITSGGGMSTCIGWTPSYDKQGNRIDSGDPNTTMYEYRCSTCKKNWSVLVKQGVETIRGPFN